MKKLQILTLILFLASPFLAISQDYEESLKLAETEIQNKNYQQALIYLDKITNDIEKEYGDFLATKLLPASIGGLEQNPDSPSNLNDIGTHNVRIIRSYGDEIEELPLEEPGIQNDSIIIEQSPKMNIMLSLTNQTDLAVQIADAHTNNSEQLDPDRLFKPIKVKDYRAILVYDKESDFASLAVIIGAATVQMDARGFGGPDKLLEYVNEINFDEILDTFGK